jgi:hypothetical protein
MNYANLNDVWKKESFKNFNNNDNNNNNNNKNNNNNNKNKELETFKNKLLNEREQFNNDIKLLKKEREEFLIYKEKFESSMLFKTCNFIEDNKNMIIIILLLLFYMLMTNNANNNRVVYVPIDMNQFIPIHQMSRQQRPKTLSETAYDSRFTN